MDLEEVTQQAFGTVPDCIRRTAHDAPSHTALIEGHNQLDYASLDSLMDRVAASLHRNGIRPQQAIAICASTSIAYAVVFLGALRAGVTVAPLAPSLKPEELCTMIADSGALLAFIDDDVEQALASAGRTLPIPHILLDADKCSGIPDGWLAAYGAPAPHTAIAPDWPFNIIYSSGTTGRPKGIVQSHAMRWGHVQRAAPKYFPQPVTLLATPLYSNTTLASFFPTLALGGTVVLMRKFDVAGYLELAQSHRATHTMLVPVQYQRIMAHPGFAQADLTSFRMKYCTSAPFSAALKADILKRWPGGLIEMYGMTEGGGTCLLAAHEFPHKLHTVGRPAPGTDMRIIDEQGREAPPGQAGEIVGRSATMMTGYHNDPARTAEAEWHDSEGRRYIRTGDIGRFDEDGFLVLVDRKKDVVISGGFNIYPSDLEAVLRQHADVSEVAVVGMPSDRWGETPVAFIVRRDGSDASAQAMLEWANARLGKMQRLSDLRFVASLPRSPIGKVLKTDLRQQAMQQIADRAA
ncbi:MAG TPA: class I adenylate-forming enzyme family protein [Noviherbaspirillum sp.]|jgi:acyl-CoA synthetase (AMP-forming)/AMP-acid ligase II|uniref:class I adenylate-forming enzyme family protein n=1 Tax=Noviherbaspirillum sp. TaxID=1926288 RepID=UPI002DDD8112|nr:class I adenylate-forming enzyme family protein [Noviherbaspirillum sp.]HEV2610092.1 class I adenylate-forming enzyme family protein [Noviherbaspirillum sp.]